MSMRILRSVTVLLLPLFSLQNPICPLCSVGYPQTTDYSSSYPRNNQIGYGSANLQFGSYPSSKSSSFYGGDANVFGSELGKAIAQRINQMYGSNPSSSYSSATNTQLPSYPDTSNYFPTNTGKFSTGSTNNMNTGYFNNNNNNNNNYVNQPVVQTQSKGSCPYCFGNQNNNGYGPYYKKAKAAKQAKQAKKN